MEKDEIKNWKWFVYITLIALAISIIIDIFTHAYYRALIWAVFFLIFIALFKKSKIPPIAHFSLSLLLLLSILGEYLFYNLFPFFDKIVHFLSPIILCVLVFNLAKDKIKNKTFLILFCIASIIALSVIWEITEYSFDNLVDSKMQGVYLAEGKFFGLYERQYEPVQTEIDDTMSDLIYNCLGSLVFGLAYFFKNRKKLKIIKRKSLVNL